MHSRLAFELTPDIAQAWRRYRQEQLAQPCIHARTILSCRGSIIPCIRISIRQACLLHSTYERPFATGGHSTSLRRTLIVFGL